MKHEEEKKEKKRETLVNPNVTNHIPNGHIFFGFSWVAKKTSAVA